MTPEQFYDFLRSHGFTVSHTGGGCTAWYRDMGNGGHFLVSQDLHHEVYPELLPQSSFGVHVGTFEGDEWVPTDVQAEHHTLESAVKHIDLILGGSK